MEFTDTYLTKHIRLLSQASPKYFGKFNTTENTALQGGKAKAGTYKTPCVTEWEGKPWCTFVS